MGADVENRSPSMRRIVTGIFALCLITGSAAAETAPGDYSPALRNRIAAAISPMRSPPSSKMHQSGGVKPLITGVTDLPEGSILRVYLKKQTGCQGSDCPPPTPPSGKTADRVVVRDGGFQAGPFSSAGSPLPPGAYPIEILLETGDPDHPFYQVGMDQVVIKPEGSSRN